MFVRVDGFANTSRADTATIRNEPIFVGFFDEHKGRSMRSVDGIRANFFFGRARNEHDSTNWFVSPRGCLLLLVVLLSRVGLLVLSRGHGMVGRQKFEIN